MAYKYIIEILTNSGVINFKCSTLRQVMYHARRAIEKRDRFIVRTTGAKSKEIAEFDVYPGGTEFFLGTDCPPMLARFMKERCAE